MTEVAFHHGAADKLTEACRLIGELYRAGRSIVVYAPQAVLAARLDQMLWSQPAIGFVPHVRAGHPLAAQTPVLLAADLAALDRDDVLVNLDSELPPAFERFRSLVEVVARDEGDRLPARARFKFYRDRGYPIASHDLSAA